MSFTAVIFDMDGVLFDSERLHHRAYVEALSSRGVEMSISWFRRNAPGVARREVLAKFAAEHDIALDIDAMAVAKGEAVRSLLSETRPLLAPNVERTLEMLSRDFALGVATSSTMGDELLKWAGLRAAFGCVVTSADVEHGKPAPDIYLEAAHRLGVDPARCLVVEDSPVGVAGARAAGMTVVGYSMSPEDVATLKDAHFVAESLDEVVERARGT